MAAVQAGVVMRPGEKNRFEILAAYPSPGTNGTRMDWVAQAEQPALEAMLQGEPVTATGSPTPAPNSQNEDRLVIIPLQNEQNVRAVAAFLVQVPSAQALARCQERLELIPLLLNHYELRSTLKDRHGATDRLRLVLEVLAVLNALERFKSAAMALCNEIAARMDCHRVSLGFLRGRYVRVQAISHTERFCGEMQLVQHIEAAMEECLDQDLEVIHPAADDALYYSRATADLSENQGAAAVLSLPIRKEGETIAVLTLERTDKRPFKTVEEVETVRLVCDLCAPRLVEMQERDRWFGARVYSWMRRHLGSLVGHEHTGIKVGMCLALALAVFITFAQGHYRIDTSFRFQDPVRQVVVAPFDTFIKSVTVEPGDKVEAGQSMLGRLDTTDLRLKLAALKAEQLGYQKQRAASMRDGKTAEAQMAQAQSDKLAAKIRLLEENIAKATLMAPINGRVVSEDLKRQIGAPVEKGEVLFEIARIESLRAELYVPEESIASVKIGQKGELASVGRPDHRIQFEVERINPIAEVVNNQNVFRVRARLLEQSEWMRPGMEGIAKIGVGKKPYLWLGSHRLADWLRMKLWI
jgi:multidrug resistance efflux pump